MLVRTWNLFHGNTNPPRRAAYLREMVDRITAGNPDIVCLQEIPAWALPKLKDWTTMQVATARARRSKLGPLPIPGTVGRAFTAPHHGRFRSGFAGQGNAILFPADAQVREYRTITLNTNVFCEERGRQLGLTPKQMVWWERERRVCQVLQYEFADRSRMLVANLHATHSAKDIRLTDAEVRRAINFVIKCSELEESLIVGGDFNIAFEQSEILQELINAPREARWSAATTGIDNVLLRRAVATSVRLWPDDERRYKKRILSDHAPLEVVVELRPKD
ncbi:MAG TPA: endonuclease/exonuclease/phosphatase family protein [Gaiellaceae bacterium]|nr:endonuclease/exonuclease/phosphatase family protein [Gaiellaceae bacterium]